MISLCFAFRHSAAQSSFTASTFSCPVYLAREMKFFGDRRRLRPCPACRSALCSVRPSRGSLPTGSAGGSIMMVGTDPVDRNRPAGDRRHRERDPVRRRGFVSRLHAVLPAAGRSKLGFRPDPAECHGGDGDQPPVRDAVRTFGHRHRDRRRGRRNLGPSRRLHHAGGTILVANLLVFLLPRKDVRRQSQKIS